MASVRFLVERYGVDPAITDNESEQPIHLAVPRAHIGIIRYLLKTGKVDPNSKTNEGMTAFDIADKIYDPNNRKMVRDILSGKEAVNNIHPEDSFGN